MASEIKSKYGSSTDLDFGSSFADLDGLANGSVAWCAPITPGTPCPPKINVHGQIKVSSSAPATGAVVEFYLLRGDDNASELRDGADLGTLTAPGTMSTAATIARARGNMALIHVIQVSTDTSAVYNFSFIVEDPGTDWQILVYNGTGQSLNATSSPHKVRYRTITPESQ